MLRKMSRTFAFVFLLLLVWLFIRPDTLFGWFIAGVVCYVCSYWELSGRNKDTPNRRGGGT